MYQLTNKEVSRILKELAKLMELKGENKFKVRAYYNASRQLINMSDNIQDLAREGKIRNIPGVGEGIARSIKEIMEKGYSPELEELKAELPGGLLEIIKIPGLGPKRAYQLFNELGVTNLEELKSALNTGKARKLKGFGVKTEENLKNKIEKYESFKNTYLLKEALGILDELKRYIKKCPGVSRVKMTGEARRKKELVNSLEILVASKEKESVLEYLRKLSFAKSIEEKEENGYLLTFEDDIRIKVFIVPPDMFCFYLFYLTGSKDHVQKMETIADDAGYQLTIKGLYKDSSKIKVKNEEEIYTTLGVSYIIPELRENRG